MVEASRATTATLVELFKKSGLEDPADTDFDFQAQLDEAISGDAAGQLVSDGKGKRGAALIEAAEARGVKSLFIDFLKALAEKSGGRLSGKVVLGAIATHLGWSALMRKRINLSTVMNMSWHFRIFSTVVGSTANAGQQSDSEFCGVANSELMSSWSFSETAHLALFGRRPTEGELYAFSVLLGLIVTNGPGTISAQGAKVQSVQTAQRHPSGFRLTSILVSLLIPVTPMVVTVTRLSHSW